MSVAKRDGYEVLGVVRDCDGDVLKASYRKLALAHHPDRNPGNQHAEEKFKEAAEAYSVLSDPQKRAAYDRFGHQGVPTAAGGGFDASGFPDLSDILNEMFGFGDVFNSGSRQQRRTRPQRGEDVRYDLDMSFEDSMRGLSVDIQVPRMEECGRCKGKGAEPEDGVVTCPTCRGRGEVIYQQAFLSSLAAPARSAAAGVRSFVVRARNAADKPTCAANVNSRSTFRPASTMGHRCVFRRKANPVHKAVLPATCLWSLKVAEHPVFERHEFDLHCTVPVNVAQAALGCSVDVLTFDGLQSVKVPEGSQAGSRIKLKGLGVPHLNSSTRGDLYVHLAVKVLQKNQPAISAGYSKNFVICFRRRMSRKRRASWTKSKTTSCSAPALTDGAISTGSGRSESSGFFQPMF